MRAKTVTSAGVVCYLNGKRFGRVRDFSWSSSTPRKALYGIDITEPQELLTTTTRITGRLSLWRTVGDGGAEGAGMIATYEDLTKEKYFSLTLVERYSDTVIFEARYCSVTSQSWNAPEKGLVTGSMEFEALNYSNEVRSAK